VIVGIICLSGIMLGVICFLMSFHCYLTCCLGFTTLDYLFHGIEAPTNNKKARRIDSTPESERRI
jgi:hypothetical protein